MDVALSSQDLKDIFDGELKILLYGDVQKYHTVDELLEPYDRVCILYNWTKHMGHWVCLFKKRDTIYFFDICILDNNYLTDQLLLTLKTLQMEERREYLRSNSKRMNKPV